MGYTIWLNGSPTQPLWNLSPWGHAYLKLPGSTLLVKSDGGRVALWLIYGHDGDSRPVIPSIGLEVHLSDGRILVIDRVGGDRYNMEGTRIIEFSDLETIEGRLDYRDYTQTGRDWPYLGFHRDAYPLEKLLGWGSWPGWYLNADRDFDIRPNALLHDGTHWAPWATDKGHVTYTDPKNPWRDRPRSTPLPPDSQHACFRRAWECKAAASPGLALLKMALTFRQKNQWVLTKAGQSRTRGGILLDMAELGSVASNDIEWALETQLDDVLRKALGGSPYLWPTFSSSTGPGWSPMELGEWFAGLCAAYPLVNDGQIKERMVQLGFLMARDLLKVYDRSTWKVPYKVGADGQAVGGAWSSSKFCRGAMRIVDLTVPEVPDTWTPRYPAWF